MWAGSGRCRRFLEGKLCTAVLGELDFLDSTESFSQEMLRCRWALQNRRFCLHVCDPETAGMLGLGHIGSSHSLPYCSHLLSSALCAQGTCKDRAITYVVPSWQPTCCVVRRKLRLPGAEGAAQREGEPCGNPRPVHFCPHTIPLCRGPRSLFAPSGSFAYSLGLKSNERIGK